MQDELNREFENLYAAMGETEIVWDGIVNPEIYATQSLKILWMLREPWVKSGFTMLCDKGVQSRIGGSPTLHVMAYVTYSILNGFPNWQEMAYLRDKPEMADALRAVAYINVKKSLGGTRSHLESIYGYFSHFESLLKRQVELINPDIIIGCSPHMASVVGWFKAVRVDGIWPSESFITDSGLLLINSYHPSAPIFRADMVNSIKGLVQSAMANEMIRSRIR